MITIGDVMVLVGEARIAVGEARIAVGGARIPVGQAEMSANAGSIRDSSVGIEVMFQAMSARFSKEFIIFNIMRSIHSYHILKSAIFLCYRLERAVF